MACAIIPSAAACAAGCCGSLACCALQSGNTSDYRVSKFLALLMQITTVSLILVLQSTDTHSWLGSVPGMNECGADNSCYSLQISYRLGFTTACVFAFHLVLTMLGRCCANKALNSFWVFKFVFVIGGAALAMFVPNSFFTRWADVASVLLGWFLVIQMVWVIDFAFSWNDLWLANAAEDRQAGKSGKTWYAGLLICSVCFLAGAYTWYGIMFSKFGSDRSDAVILGINIGVSTVLGVVSVFSPRGGILPASLTILYIAWLSWSTVVSGDLETSNNSRLWIGMILAGVVLLYATFQGDVPQVASNETKESSAPCDAVNSLEAAPVQESMRAIEAAPKKTVENTNEAVGSWKYIFIFNSMHLSAACYLMNLTLSWANSSAGLENRISYWVQGVSAWAMLTLYAWTLIAPIICPSREF